MTPLKDLLNDIALLNRVPVEEIPNLLGELETLRARLWARLMGSKVNADDAENDERLGVKETAALLNLSTDWLYRHGRDLPFCIKIGRTIGFSRRGAERWMRQRAGR